MSYQNDPGHGAVIVQETPVPSGGTARVVLETFSFHEIRDDRSIIPPDRATHLYRIFDWFGSGPSAPSGGVDIQAAVTCLEQNYPNPFNPSTTIAFSLGAETRVSLKIYDVAGRLVRTLVDEKRKAAPYREVWDGLTDTGAAAASGIYIYVLKTERYRESRKMLLIK
jgi:hypothetical protein